MSTVCVPGAAVNVTRYSTPSTRFKYDASCRTSSYMYHPVPFLENMHWKYTPPAEKPRPDVPLEFAPGVK